MPLGLLLSETPRFQSQSEGLVERGLLKWIRCECVHACHYWNDERKDNYLAKVNGDSREKDGKKKKKKDLNIK